MPGGTLASAAAGPGEKGLMAIHRGKDEGNDRRGASAPDPRWLARNGLVLDSAVHGESLLPGIGADAAIATMRGLVAAGDLKPGDRLITRDGGPREIVWVGRCDLTEAELARQPGLAPVRIAAGALGNGLPDRALTLSPHHRLLLRSEAAALYFSEREVLAPAGHLVGLPGISRVQDAAVSYVHVLCDRHELTLANSSWAETFQPGTAAMAGLGPAERREIRALVPDLSEGEGPAVQGAARRTLTRQETRLLLDWTRC